MPQENSPGKWLQIIHSRGDHWTVASVNAIHPTPPAKVTVYDSVYDSLDSETKATVTALFRMRFQMSRLQKQEGGRDCGLFTIAVSIALALNPNHSKMNFDQGAMRPHLVKCFEEGSLT